MRAIEVAAGETFDITLKGHPTAGYDWNVEVEPEEVVKLVDRLVEPEGEAVGGPAEFTFTFLARAEGEATLTFTYKRQWETDTEDVKVVDVTVGPRSGDS